MISPVTFSATTPHFVSQLKDLGIYKTVQEISFLTLIMKALGEEQRVAQSYKQLEEEVVCLELQLATERPLSHALLIAAIKVGALKKIIEDFEDAYKPAFAILHNSFSFSHFFYRHYVADTRLPKQEPLD